MDEISTDGNNNDLSSSEKAIDQPDLSITWEGPEYIFSNKSYLWSLYVLLGGAVLTAVIYLATKDWITSLVVVVSTIVIAIYGQHKPQIKKYALGDEKITVGDKSYFYSEFKSYYVEHGLQFSGTTFIPFKRFSFIVSVYYPNELADKVSNAVAQKLPLEQNRINKIDKLMNRLNF